jgi:hypothetical protein
VQRRLRFTPTGARSPVLRIALSVAFGDLLTI